MPNHTNTSSSWCRPNSSGRAASARYSASLSDVAENIDSDGADGEATDDVGLNGEAHGAPVIQSLQFVVRAATIQ
jgi:hypothetical protein